MKALYPSISVDLALKALEHALETTELEIFDNNLREAAQSMTDLALNNTFVNYKGRSFKCIKGIPTGGSVSRQNADTFLHWMLFKAPDNIREKVSLWYLIRIWKRFIDDVFGVWLGTKRQFSLFMTALNKEAERFGINFDKFTIGEEVDFLDTKCYIKEGKIKYRLYRKPTDAR